MGIIDDYLKGSDSEPAAAPSVGTGNSSSLLNQYMSVEDKPRKAGEKLVPAGAPIDGKVEYIPESERAARTYKGDPVTPDFPSVTEAIGKRFGEGLNLMSEGASDVFNKKPATGVGKAALGALSLPASLVSGPADVVDKLTGSEIGTRATMVLPVAPSGKLGASVVKNAIPSNKAFSTLVDQIGPENAGMVAREMRADPRLTPADLSPAVKQATQQLFVTEGDKAKNYIAGFANKRTNEAAQATDDAINASLGTAVNPVQKIDELTNKIKAVGANEINPVLKQTKPVDLTPVVEHIDSVLKPGVMQVISNPENMLPYDKVQKLLSAYRERLTNDKTVLTDPDVLNKLQSNMRRNAQDLMRTPDPEAKAMGYALFQLRNKVIDAVGKAGPQTVDKAGNPISAYRASLDKYRDENHVAEAFQHGHDAIIKNGKNLEDHPEFFKRWVSSATDTEKEAAKEGARLAIEQAIKGYRTPAINPASKAVQLGQVDFNRQRIETLFGKEEADKLFKKLDNERVINETNNDLIRGSQTAMRAGANSAVALPTKTDVRNNVLGIGAAEGVNMLTSGAPGLGTALYGGAKLAAFAKDKIATALAKERNTQLAKYALPTEGPSRDELIRNLEAVAAKHSASVPRLGLMSKVRLGVTP